MEIVRLGTAHSSDIAHKRIHSDKSRFAVVALYRLDRVAWKVAIGCAEHGWLRLGHLWLRGLLCWELWGPRGT